MNITIAGTVRDEVVEAEVIGPLAFHEAIGSAVMDAPYSITHVKTGYRIFGARTKTQARTAIMELLALPVSWDFTDPKAVKRWKVRDALANIRWRALA